MDPVAIAGAIVLIFIVLAALVFVGMSPKGKTPVKTSSSSKAAVKAIHEARDRIVEAHLEDQFAAMGKALAAPLTSFTVQASAPAPAPRLRPSRLRNTDNFSEELAMRYEFTLFEIMVAIDPVWVLVAAFLVMVFGFLFPWICKSTSFGEPSAADIVFAAFLTILAIALLPAWLPLYILGRFALWMSGKKP